MHTFVLVHGAWHDGDTWQEVADELRRRGHTVHAPTVAGHGKGVDKAVSHDEQVRSVVDHVVDHDLHDVVLLGHSYGGTIVARVAEEVPERLRRLVFWNAFVPAAGNSLIDEVPPHYRDLFAALAAASPDNTVTLPFPVWREAFIQDADLELAESTYARLSSEPYGALQEKLDLGRFYSLEMPRSFINALDDTALPPGEWGWHPRMSSRLGLHRLVQLPGSHEVMFTDPALLALKIVEAGRD